MPPLSTAAFLSAYDARAAQDLPAILALPPMECYSRVVMRATDALGEGEGDLFTVAMFVYRHEEGEWLFQLFDLSTELSVYREGLKPPACFGPDGFEPFGGPGVRPQDTSPFDGGFRDIAKDEHAAVSVLAVIRGVVAKRFEALFSDRDALTDGRAVGRNAVEDEPPKDLAVAAILALKEEDCWTEDGRGPCLNNESEHDPKKGYAFYEWRIHVSREGDFQPFRFTVQRRDERKGQWLDEDFGMSIGSLKSPFEWSVEPSNVAQALETFRALRRLQEDEYDDPAYRAAHGVTDEHLRTGTLSIVTRAEIEGEKVAA